MLFRSLEIISQGISIGCEIGSPVKVIFGGEVVLVNNYGVDVVVTDTTMVVKPSVNTAGIVCSPPTDTAGAALVPANTIAIGSKAVFLCEFGPTDTYVASQRYDGIIEIEFNQVGGAYPFTTTGVVSTVAQ